MANRFEKEIKQNYFVATYKSKTLIHKIKIFTASEAKAKKEALNRLVAPFQLISVEPVFIGNSKDIPKDK